MTKLTFTTNNADIYASNILQKKAWVNIKDGYIYIARDKGRSYWILKNISLDDRPIIYFNDENKSIRIGTNKIIIKSLSKYTEAKKYLEPYSKKSKKTRNSTKSKKSTKSTKSKTKKK